MSAVLNLVGASLLLLPGLVVLVAGNAKLRTRALGAFLVGWACVTAAFALRDVSRPLAFSFGYPLGTALQIFLTGCLLYVVLESPGRPRTRRADALLMVVGAYLLAVAAYFAVDPRAFWTADGVPEPAFDLLVNVPFALAFIFACASLGHEHRVLRRGQARREVTLLLLGVGLYVGYNSAYFLLFEVGLLRRGLAEAVSAAYLLLWGLGVAAVGGTALQLLLRQRHGTGDRALGAALLTALALGFATAAPVLVGVDGLGISGLFTIVAAFLLAYGMLKHQVFGLDLNAKRFLQRGAPVAAFLLLGLAGATLGENLAPPDAFAGMPAFLAVGVATGGTGAAVAFPLRRRLADALFPDVEDSAAYAKRRALDVYQAALAQALAAGGDEDDAALVVLRDRLGLTASDHRALAYAVRAELDAAPPKSDATFSVASRYERGSILKEGPAARVWRARDKETGREVVLKQFRAGDAAPHDEARAAQGLANPHVVEVLGLFEDEERRPTLVLEYVEGGSLQRKLDEEGRLALAPSLAIAADVLRGLVAVHARDVVHQDIKPDNILLTPEGRAKLTDFGIAARAEQDLGQTMAAGAGAGTVLYMAPEQALARPVAVAADLYAVGAVLYRCLAGRLPFAADGAEYEIKRRIVEEPPLLPVEDQPEAVNRLLARALAKAPRERFGSAAEMLAAVEAAA